MPGPLLHKHIYTLVSITSGLETLQMQRLAYLMAFRSIESYNYPRQFGDFSFGSALYFRCPTQHWKYRAHAIKVKIALATIAGNIFQVALKPNMNRNFLQ